MTQSANKLKIKYVTFSSVGHGSFLKFLMVDVQPIYRFGA